MHPLVPVRPLVAGAVLAAVVALLHVFLWSRVVRIRCARSPQSTSSVTLRSASCDVDESSIALTNQYRIDASDARRAELRGEVSRSRGDTRIVFTDGGAEHAVTTGFNGDKHGQRVAAERIDRFLHDDSSSVEVAFGSRWGTALIFLAVFGGLLVLLYPFIGYRLRVTLDKGAGTIGVRRGVWPFASSFAIPLASFDGFRVEGSGRVRLVAAAKGQPPLLCTFRITHRAGVARAAHRLNQWVRAELDGV
jgi:hypothetical protein